jgi:rhodanese-related sulfurtransferase
MVLRRWWMVRNVPRYAAQEVEERLKGGGSVLLDVRTEAERSHGSIAGSVHIPNHQLRSRLDELERLRGKEIIVYCASGNRSLGAAALLLKNNYLAANMKGGIAEWNFSRLRTSSHKDP